MNHIFTKKQVMRTALACGIGIGCIVDNGSIIRYQSQLQERRDTELAKQTETRQEETRTTEVQKDSETALERAKSGCIPIVLTRNNKPVLFNEKIRVFDANTFPTNPKLARFDKNGNPINGVQPLPKNRIVCNQFGDTAIVGSDGWLTNIKVIEPNQLSKFKEFIK